jgi:ADP-heptose:LPS heptosyltransferase
VAGLDLVIAADTAVAHLAATMGKPVWLLSRFRGCWRWLHDRADSPWYPSLRVMRQTRLKDWSGVLAEIRRDLEAIAASGDQA